MKAGSYHTIEIEPNRPFEVYKQTWDSLDIERIKQACDPAASADLAVLLVTVRNKISKFSPFHLSMMYELFP